MKPYKIFCREIYKNHPQGRGILPFDFWMEKYQEELESGYEFLNS